MKNCVFIAASAQHVGKTSASTGVVHGIKKFVQKRAIPGSVGYMKPVGQKSVCLKVGSRDIVVDKDVPVFKNTLGCAGDYSEMSPVLIGKTYTRRFLDGEISAEAELTRIRRCFENISAKSTFTVVEGTGHVGVGSVVGLGNARVAAQLGVPMVLVLNGGIGSTIDEFVMNRETCLAEGASIRGVILNKVIPEKVEEIRHYTGEALQRYFDTPLLGVVPDIEAVPNSVHKHEKKLNTQEEERTLETANHYSNNIDVSLLIDVVNQPECVPQLQVAGAIA